MVSKISVAVNSWDCLDGLKLFVKSYIDNTFDKDNTELCIALDGSSEESIAFLEEFDSRKDLTWVWDEHKGLSHSLNNAFSLCNYEYTLWASDDYVFMPNWDKELRKYLHPEHFISIYTFEPHNSPFPSIEGLDYSKLMQYLSNTSSMLSGELGYTFGNGVFATDKMREVGGFDEHFFEGSMDGDFIYRMHKAFPELIFFKPGDISFYHFSSSTRAKHPEVLDKAPSDIDVFFNTHGHAPGRPLYEKIKIHCADKGHILESRGIIL